MRFILFLSIINYTFSQTNLFISEYGEGSSNNKFLEIYNPTSQIIYLDNFAFPSSANEVDNPGNYEYWNDFDEGTFITPGNVFIIAHPSADPEILSNANMTHTYLSNGNDGYCIVEGDETNFTKLDCIGDWNGNETVGWDVAGIPNGTVDHTLVRKSSVIQGNLGNWTESAGTSDANSEWIVLDQDVWDNIGFHVCDNCDGNSSEPMIIIQSPGNYSEIYTDDVEIVFSIYNFEIGSEGFVYYNFNDTEDGYLSEATPIQFSDLDEGSYTVTLELVDNNQNPLDPAVEAEVEFTVNFADVITISEIQENVSTYEGQLVNVIGVVTIGDGLLFPGRTKFYIQDESGRGIQIYNASELAVTYNRGDFIQVVGTVEIYNDDVEIINPDITLLDIDYPLPGPHIIVGDESLTMNGTWSIASGQLSDYWHYLSGSTEFTALTITLENGYNIQTMFWNSAVPSSELAQFEDMVGEELSISGVITFYNGDVQSTCGYYSDIEDNTDPTIPVAQAGPDQVVLPGVVVTLDGSASSDDGDIIAYEWVQIDGIPVIIDDEESAVTSFTAPEQNDVIVFRLTIWDNDINESSDEVTITITGPVTIYEIQYTEEQGQYCYESNLFGEIVTTSGIVTAVVPDSPFFYIQDFNYDSYAGIYINDNSYNPVVGQEVTVSGTVYENYSFTELIDLTSFTVNSPSNDLEIKDITTGELANGCTESGESLEGMLVRVSIVSVTQESNEYGEWYVDDGTGPCQIDDGAVSAPYVPMYDGIWPEPGINDSFMNIAGVVDYNYNEFAILPRNSNDFDNELSINQTALLIPVKSNLSQNYPNPFNPTTVINFNVERFERIKISIFDLNGKRVNTLLDKYLNKGNYSIEWNGNDNNENPLSSGTYIYQYQSSENILSKKMILLK